LSEQQNTGFFGRLFGNRNPRPQRPLPPRNVGQALNRNVGSTPTAGPNAGQVPSTVSRENQMPANRAQNTAFNPAEVARQRVMSRQRADDVDTASKSSVAMNRRVPAPATPSSSSTATTTPRNRFQQPASTVASAADRQAFRSRTGSTVNSTTGQVQSSQPASTVASAADRQAFRSRTGSTVDSTTGQVQSSNQLLL
jgi:hypothetical protein